MTPSGSPVDRRALREKAEAATQGQWVALHNDGVAGVTLLLHPETQHDIAHLENLDANTNADFIAAANPSTVLELLDEIERLRDALIPFEWRMQVRVNVLEPRKPGTPTGHYYCPTCNRYKDEGHAPDCKVAAALSPSPLEETR